LTTFWIKSPVKQAGLGFGVTAWSLSEALNIIGALGYRHYLPEDLNEVCVDEGVTVEHLDQGHVLPNMGPIIMRGMWYPFVAFGLPDRAEERLRGRSSWPQLP
jgi:hypothetical protein